MLALLAQVTVACADTRPTGPDEQPASEVHWISVAAGGLALNSLTCGLTADYTAYCWGSNAGGALGGKSVNEARAPVAVSNVLKFKQLAPGSQHTCGISVHDTVYCWGDWDFTATGSSYDDLAAARVMNTGTPLVSLTSGSWRSCGLTMAGNAICWGGVPHRDSAFVTKEPYTLGGGKLFTTISAGNAGGASYFCGVTHLSLAYCWGDNYSRSLGADATVPSILIPEPVAVAGGLRFKMLDAGYITCGIAEDDKVYCWGGEWSYPPFTNNVAGGPVPAPLHGGIQFATISVGGHHACGLTAAGEAYCWGSNDKGQLGDGTAISGSNIPVHVAGGIVFTTISAGNSHSCGTTAGGRAYCWGLNDSGQLGDGSVRSTAPLNDFRRVPTLVKNPAL